MLIATAKDSWACFKIQLALMANVLLCLNSEDIKHDCD